MLHVRISYDDSSEKEYAIELTKYIVKALSSKYDVETSWKVYKNRRNTGGRIYLNVKPKKR